MYRGPKLMVLWVAVNERASDEARLAFAITCMGFWRVPDEQ